MLPMKLRTLLASLLITGSLISSSTAPDESDRANALFEQFFDEGLRLSPMSQSSLGLKWDYDRWDDLSEPHERRQMDLTRRQLELLRNEIDPELLDEETRVSYDLWVQSAEVEMEAFRFRLYDYTLNQMYGWQSIIPSFLINIHRIETRSDAEDYIARLRGVSVLMDQVIARVDEQAERGLLPPKFVFDLVLSDSRNVVTGHPFDSTGNDNVLLDDFRTKVTALDLPATETDQLLTEASSALLEHVGPAYRHLISRIPGWRESASTDDGVWRMPDGADYYAFNLKDVTTTDLDADAIHEIGLREVDRIHGEMREIMEKVDFDGTLQEFFDFMRDDPRFYYENTEAGKQRYLDEATALIDSMRTRLPELFIRMPEADVVVKAVEPFREATAGKAFYQRPSPDGSRPGTYYANLHDMGDMPTYQMEALAYHEGIPGHHMQIAIAQELEGLPRFRRFGGYTAYVEGWGLYSELIPKEIGFYSDPYSDFGRLAMELWRACRLVVDTGIHHKRWSREEAIDYLAENTPNPPGDIEKAIERYIVLPGQATAYKIGMNEIVRLREVAQERLGDAFDLRRFHDVVLRHGPLPLSTLEDVVERWIEEGGDR